MASSRPTNNEAEMTALLRALRYELTRPAAERVHVYSDSLTALREATGGWRPKGKAMQGVHDQRAHDIRVPASIYSAISRGDG